MSLPLTPQGNMLKFVPEAQISEQCEYLTMLSSEFGGKGVINKQGRQTTMSDFLKWLSVPTLESDI